MNNLTELNLAFMNFFKDHNLNALLVFSHLELSLGYLRLGDIFKAHN